MRESQRRKKMNKRYSEIFMGKGLRYYFCCALIMHEYIYMVTGEIIFTQSRNE